MEHPLGPTAPASVSDYAAIMAGCVPGSATASTSAPATVQQSSVAPVTPAFGSDTEPASSDQDSMDSSLSTGDFDLPTRQRKRLRRQERRASQSSHSDDTVKSVPHTLLSSHTVLFRLTGASASVSNLRLVQLEEFLESEAPGEVREIRINRAKNIMAVDAATVAGVNKLLSLTRLCSAPARPFLPLSTSASMGTIRVPDKSLDDEVLSRRLRSSVPFSSVRRLGKEGEAVKIVFSSAPLPPFVHIGSVKFVVRAFKSNPVQCFKCGRFGHQSSACQRERLCLTCAGSHETSSCPAGVVPKCINCGKAHSANDKSCSVRQLETAAHRIALMQHIPTKEARKVLQRKRPKGACSAPNPQPYPNADAMPAPSTGVPAFTTVQGAAHSYSDAVKGRSAPSPASPDARSPAPPAAQAPPEVQPTNKHPREPKPPAQPVPGGPPVPLSGGFTFSSFIKVAFSVLRAVLQIPCLPEALRGLLALVLPFEHSLLSFFRA